MRNAIKITTCFVLLLLFTLSFASTSKIKKDKMELVKTGPIMENKVISGYYCFYIKEEQGRNNLFQLEIINKNMETKQNLEIILDRLYIIKDIYRSGAVFAIEYASTHPEKPKSLIEFYDAAGKKINSWEKEGSINFHLEAVPGLGYLKLENVIKPEKTVLVSLLNEKGNQIWEYKNDKISNVKNIGGFIEYAGEKLIAIQYLGSDYQAIFFIDSRTGKDLFNFNLREKGYYYDYQRIDVHLVNDQIILYGQENVYNENNKLDMHAGFFVKVFEWNGKPVTDKHFNWTKNLAKWVTFKEASGEINRKMLFFDLVKSGDKFYAICQKYNIDKKEVLTDSSLIADRKNLTSSTFRYFMIFQLNKNFEIENVRLAPTELKSYNFIEMSEDEKEFSIIACEGALNTIKDVAVTSFVFDPIKDKMMPGGKTAYVHSVTIHRDGKISSGKLELDGKATYVSIYPSLPGQIAYMFYKDKGKDYERKILSLN